MKQQIKRILSACLALLLSVGFLGVFAVPAAAESGTCGENLTWTLENGTLTISGTGPIPEFSQESPAPWLQYSNGIQTIHISDGVTVIGSNAFYHCERLTAAVIPASVKALGSHAFAGCYSLSQITMSGVEKIGRGCFYECISLTNIVLPEGLKTIEDKAFYRCRGLAGIIIPSTVTSFGTSVFTYCENLVYVKILAILPALPYWTFYGCDRLNELHLPATIEAVGEHALNECPNLNSVYYNGSETVKQQIQQQLDEETTKGPMDTADTKLTYTQTDSAVIVTRKENAEGTSVNASVTDPSGWNDLVDAVVSTDKQNDGTTQVTVEIQAGQQLPEEVLLGLYEKEVVVNIHTSQNVDWQVIVRDQNTDTLKGSQDFSVSMSKNDQGKYTDVIGAAESYTVTLGNTTLNSTVLFPLGVDTARKVATLYVVDGAELRKLSSVIVDDDGKAAFHVAGTEAGEYVVALNVQNIPQEEVRVPQKLAAEYDITYGATLMDAYGNQYVLTGRVNKLGFGIGTLTLIVVGVLVGTGVLVGVIMTIWNKQNQKFAKQKHTKKKL